jgi:hypothetical protein
MLILTSTSVLLVGVKQKIETERRLLVSHDVFCAVIVVVVVHSCDILL